MEGGLRDRTKMLHLLQKFHQNCTSSLTLGHGPHRRPARGPPAMRRMKECPGKESLPLRNHENRARDTLLPHTMHQNTIDKVCVVSLNWASNPPLNRRPCEELIHVDSMHHYVLLKDDEVWNLFSIALRMSRFTGFLRLRHQLRRARRTICRCHPDHPTGLSRQKTRSTMGIFCSYGVARIPESRTAWN